jgi:hypothetical protein
MRLRQRRQVSNGPSHYIAVAMQVAVSLFRSAQHARDIPRDGWLLRQYDYALGFRAAIATFQ